MALVEQFLTVKQVEELARELHAGQTDKAGRPYIEHVAAVAFGVAAFGSRIEAGAWLHDVIEDTRVKPLDLISKGVHPESVAIALLCTKVRGAEYEAYIRRIATSGDRGAVLVKIADNAHNARADRLARLNEATRRRLELRYANAQPVLWAAAERPEVEHILQVVNPGLLEVARRELSLD